jgi:hypothetical protein
MRVAGINREPTGTCVLPNAKGDHLDRVYSDQKVLAVIRQGRLVLVNRGKESQN